MLDTPDSISRMEGDGKLVVLAKGKAFLIEAHRDGGAASKQNILSWPFAITSLKGAILP
jgi:hypothetical protein